jgi:hypothetical protein
MTKNIIDDIYYFLFAFEQVGRIKLKKQQAK